MLQQIAEFVKEASVFFEANTIEITSKGSISDFVTSADLQVEAFLKEKLLTLLPNSGFIGEESSSKDYNHDYLWIVDPIDGTANFVRGLGASAISVGLVHNSRPIMGVVYNPYTDELFSAQEGKGAFLNNVPIFVSRRDFAHSHFCTGMSLYDKHYAPPCFRIMERVYEKCDDVRRLGSAALELCTLACGRCDIYFEIRIFPWDYAAALIILKEAGGFYSTIESSDIPFDRPIPLLAANNYENLSALREIVIEELPKIPYAK